MRNHYLSITLLAVLGWQIEAQAQDGTRQVPRLVVNITIDQLRSDYLDTYAPYYGTNGFKKLLAEGLVYENATFPYVSPDKASAISTIITGTTPSYHSIIGEQWLDRSSLRPIHCTEDPMHPGVPSPAQLAVSTLGDELKVSTQGSAKIFAIAPFENMAVLAAGHAADGAIWMNEKSGLWLSSQYYSNSTPQFALNYNELNRTTGNKKYKEWQPLISQQKPDFKHVFKGNRRYQEYQTSGLINADITELAISCVSQEGMGMDDMTDLLCLTYYAGSFDHKPVTECQKELKDTYIRLDKELGDLVSRLESQIGKENLLFVITSTGYSHPDGTAYAQYRIPTGTFYVNRTANLLNMYFGTLWGQGKYIEACYDNQLFLNHKLLESKRISLTDVCQRAQEFISQMAGVRNVYTSWQLLNGSNGQLLRLHNSFYAQRNGDIWIEVAPGWHLHNEDTNTDRLSEASAPAFPIIIYGADMPAGHVSQPVTTDRIAPTIAKTIHIRAPNACTAEPLF